MSEKLWLHLDLKGAPPSQGYLVTFLTWIRQHYGPETLQGLLIEYEDQFPYQGDRSKALRHPCSAFEDREALKSFLEVTKSLQLKVIPLVQTLGHLEFVLKHTEFAQFREIPEFCQCLDASGRNEEVYALLDEMLDDVTSFHDEHGLLGGLHLGLDEVWHLGRGTNSREVMEKVNSKTYDLFLNHVEKVVTNYRKKWPAVKLLLWDDMLRTVPGSVLRSKSELLSSLDLVAWNYTLQPESAITKECWDNYLSIYSGRSGKIWAATAFKGASSSRAKLPPILYHVENQLAWRKLCDKGPTSVITRFEGVILTGWQRFDHFAALCELLPAAIPSLVCCLNAWRSGGRFTRTEREESARILGLDEAQFLENSPETDPNKQDKSAPFPGYELFLLMNDYLRLETDYNAFVNGDFLATWFNDLHRQTGQVSKLHLTSIGEQATELIRKVELFDNHFVEVSVPIYDKSVIEEWQHCFLKPKSAQLHKLLNELAPFLQQSD